MEGLATLIVAVAVFVANLHGNFVDGAHGFHAETVPLQSAFFLEETHSPTVTDTTNGYSISIGDFFDR